MSWEQLPIISLLSVIFWLCGIFFAFKGKRPGTAVILSAIGTAIFLVFIISMWISLGRPPMRTMGETRLWYSLFLSIIGILLYARFKYHWLLAFSILMAVVFIGVNIFKPEIHDRAIMPALQSAWFVPHVIVYMMAYALLGANVVFVLYLWFRPKKHVITPQELGLCDTLIRIGWAFLTLGMVMGALWAKQAWGDYWSWDPKETWAAATWFSYLLYLHLRQRVKDTDVLFTVSIFSFLLLQMCWWGSITYLPHKE